MTKFVNTVMESGKKSIAEGIVYGAFDLVAERAKDDPVKVWERALANVQPKVEVKSRRVGGATYQVPVDVRPDRALALGMRWIIGASRFLTALPLFVDASKELARELLLHRAAVRAIARRADDPAHAEGERAIRADVDGNLVGRAAHAARLDLDLGLNVGERALPHLHRIVLGALGDEVECAVDDALGDGLLARLHDGVDELRDAATRVDRLIRELRIGERLALRNFTFTWHVLFRSRNYLGRLAPYFERP